MSLKGRIKNYARRHNIAAQVVLQNYMFERFLDRLSSSDYASKFVIKGGMLIASIVGMDTRATMDLDTTVRDLPLSEEKMVEAIKNISNISMSDDIKFEIKSIAPIRKDDRYGGFCARLDAIYDTIVTPLSIDISTGDVITPAAVQYEFSGMFNDDVKIKLWGYNIETVMAEKVETILSRNIFNTRPRDYYDVFILGTTQRYDQDVFKEAMKATAEHRGSLHTIANIETIMEQITDSIELRNNWGKYQRKFAYARTISYDSIMQILKVLLK